MSRYTYRVADTYNVFGGGHNYRLTLYRGDKRCGRWYFDSLFGSSFLRRKIRKVEAIYGATREQDAPPLNPQVPNHS